MSCIKTSDVDPLVYISATNNISGGSYYGVVSEKSDIFCLVSAQFDQIFVLRWQL